jgi:HSP20 family protein
MSMVRYSPFDAMLPLTMSDAMGRLLDEDFLPGWRMDLFDSGRRFPVDVYENESSYVIEAALPGVRPEDLKVTATGSTITIRATTRHDKKHDEKDEEEARAPSSKKPNAYVQRERYTGEMLRVIELPELVTPEKVKAIYKHGVLTLEAPKATESPTRKIDIVVEE